MIPEAVEKSKYSKNLLCIGAQGLGFQQKKLGNRVVAFLKSRVHSTKPKFHLETKITAKCATFKTSKNP